MELFLLEHKKLWRKSSVKISVLLCFLYVVIFGGVLSYQWFTFGSHNDYTSSFGNNFDGYTMIKNKQEYGEGYGGELTDETLRQMVMDYQRLESADLAGELKITDWQTISSYLKQLYPELNEPDRYQIMISYVDPEKLTGLYEKRENAIEVFLENNGQTGKEKDVLLQMNEEIKEPFKYEWVGGWSYLLSDFLPDIGMVMALFLAIILSPLFSGEWHDNTSALVLTTKNGWKKIAVAKIAAGLAFTVELSAIIAACDIAAQLFFLGTAGWDMPIQLIKLISIAPMNMLQAEIYEYAFTFLGAIGFAGIVMLLSAKTKSNVLTLLFSLAVVYGPMMIAGYLPYGAQKALDLIPLAGSGADIFRTNTFCIFGKYIWSPYLLITVPVMIGMICVPFAVKGWSRRMKI